MIIYKLTSPSGKCYIGKTKSDMETRWNQHLHHWRNTALSEAKRPTRLHHAFNKYPPDQWTREVIAECTEETITLREIELIAENNSYTDGYNMTLGGEGLSGMDFPEIQRRNMSEARKAFFRTEAGLKWKKELSDRLTANNPRKKGDIGYTKGMKMPPRSEEYRAKLSQSLTGREFSEEHRKNIGKAHKGRTLTEEHRKKIGQGLIGHKQSDHQKETVRAKMSASWEVTHPDGKREIIHNLNAFCRLHNLDQSNLSRGSNRKYRARRLTAKGESVDFPPPPV